MLLFRQAIGAFERQISKTRRYANVGCCEVKILHSERNPGPSARPNSFRGQRRYCVLSFLFLSFFPTLCRGPSSWGRTANLASKLIPFLTPLYTTNPILYTSPHERPTPLCTADAMLCTSPHDRFTIPPLRFLVPIAGNTQADDTLPIWLGAVRELGYLGRIPNCSEVPEPPPPPFIPLGTPPPPGTPPGGLPNPPPQHPPPPPWRPPKVFAPSWGMEFEQAAPLEVEDPWCLYIRVGAMQPAQLTSCLSRAANVSCAFTRLFADHSIFVS